jgi:c-di-GMP-binding flagellar brake protein YcgR
MEEEKELQIQIGDALQLQFVSDDTKKRHFAKVIGYLKGHSVLITTPRIDGKAMITREDQLVIVRMMTGNQVYGFTTSILKTNLKPYPYLHLAYPKEMEQITVRKAQRVNTRLIASVEITNPDDEDLIQSIPTLVSDISTGGAMLSARHPIGEAGDIVSIAAKIQVGNIEEYISIPAIVRNYRESHEEGEMYNHHYGVEFQLLEQHDHFVLHGYVYEQLLQQMKK